VCACESDNAIHIRRWSQRPQWMSLPLGNTCSSRTNEACVLRLPITRWRKLRMNNCNFANIRSFFFFYAIIIKISFRFASSAVCGMVRLNYPSTYNQTCSRYTARSCWLRHCWGVGQQQWVCIYNFFVILLMYIYYNLCYLAVSKPYCNFHGSYNITIIMYALKTYIITYVIIVIIYCKYNRQ